MSSGCGWRDGLQLRRVAVITLNKHLQTADKGLCMGPTTLHLKKKLVTKCSKDPWTQTDSLDKRPKQHNMDMRFGTGNVRSLFRVGSLITISRELFQCKLDLVGVQLR
jgi:hypothetical protein